MRPDIPCAVSIPPRSTRGHEEQHRIGCFGRFVFRDLCGEMLNSQELVSPKRRGIGALAAFVALTARLRRAKQNLRRSARHAEALAKAGRAGCVAKRRGTAGLPARRDGLQSWGVGCSRASGGVWTLQRGGGLAVQSAALLRRFVMQASEGRTRRSSSLQLPAVTRIWRAELHEAGRSLQRLKRRSLAHALALDLTLETSNRHFQ